MISAQALLALFTQIDSTRCEIYEIYEFNFESDVSLSGDLETLLAIADRTDKMSGFVVDTTVPITDGRVISIDYSFTIASYAREDNFQFKDISFKIIVCGSETITNTNLTPYEIVMDIGPNAVGASIGSLSFFSTDDAHCPTVNYYIRTSTADTIDNAQRETL